MHTRREVVGRKALPPGGRGGGITDGEVTKILRNLVNYGFLEKRGDLYVVPDPALRKALEALRC
ncbi:MAG: hypothetical protein QXS00_00635 [Pyrobaculum sp.]|uniref:hypothetical protein n=1 Tax=Pyrobaculum sp. TaxID=2004705 RepID=UPI0031744434